MCRRLLLFVKNGMNQKRLLFFNAILCLCYPLCYVLLILLPFGDEALGRKLYGGGVVLVNILFLLILTLNLNTIRIVHSQLASPGKKLVRTVYFVTMLVWSLYILVAWYSSVFIPGFISHFHHHVRLSFWTSSIKMNLFGFVFSVGLGLLFWEYYVQEKLKYMLVFIIPGIIYFSFKTLLPFNLFIISWVVFSGCQFLLYYSIVDGYWSRKRSLLHHPMEKMQAF